MPKTTTGGASNASAGPGETGYVEPDAEAADGYLPPAAEAAEPAPEVTEEPEPVARDGGGRFAAAPDPDPEPAKKNGGSPAPAPITGSGGVTLPKPGAGGS